MAEDKRMKGTAEYVPGSASEAGNADRITRSYLDSMLLELRHMGNELPSTDTVILGKHLPTPVMASPMALLNRVRPDTGAAGFAEGVKNAGTIMWCGWVSDEEYKEIAETGAMLIRGIKPFEDEDVIFRAIETAEEAGAVGIFMDIDHAFDDAGRDCGFAFGQLSHKSLGQLASYVKAAHIPFIFKGILSASDARKCSEIGAAGVMVSHHKGIWSYTVPPLMVLPEIREAAGDMEVFADCGISSGIDVFKALARGAEGTGTARKLLSSYAAKGTDGVYDTIMEMTEELAGTMAKTGCPDTAHIDPSVIRMKNW